MDNLKIKEALSDAIVNDETTEFKVKADLQEKRRKINSFEDLCNFIKYIKDNCNTGYGVAPRSIAQAMLGVGWYLSSIFGITGFQASCVMWDVIVDSQYPHNKTGLKIVDFDDMLYPQYERKFDKIISHETWEALQKEAKKSLEENTVCVHPDVRAHWQSIVDGNVPFDFTVED